VAVNNFPGYSPGGTERRIFEVCKKLAEDHDVYFTSKYYTEEQPSENKVDGVKILSFGPKPSEEWSGYKVRKDFIKTIDETDADIYINGAWGMLTGLTALVAKKNRSKFIYLAASQGELQRGWQDMPLNRRITGRIGLYLADKIVSHSEDLHEYIKANLHKRDSKFKWFYHGYEVPELDLSEKEKRIIWIARFKQWKQPEKFLDLAERVDAPDWKFDLIGFGPNEYEEKLRERCEGIENANFVGRVDQGEDWEWYKKASILVNTSESGMEGFPNSFVQSLLCGTLVASLNCDPDGLIRERDLGFKAENIAEMVEWIEEKVKEEELRETQKKIKENSAKIFNLENAVQNYQRIFKE